MRRADLTDVRRLVGAAREHFIDDPAASEVLDAAQRRLQDPLRLAVAGMVKAGKSTLLNGLIGERIAPTDAGECTRTITWYRYARSPRITIHLRDGTQTLMPVRRDHGRLVLDLGQYSADDVSWIGVDWPSESLRSTVLIDTPGIGSLSTGASARSAAFLTPESAPSVADAIIYLLRHVHASDLAFLEAFRDTAAGASQTTNAVAVLSRADEVGSGRVDSMLSASRIAARYRSDGDLRSLALGVIPVAGLVAEAARTLREDEFASLLSLAMLDRSSRDRLLVSVDRFVRPSTTTALPTEVRSQLLARFGIYGVRLGVGLVQNGARRSSELAERMIEQSGLLDVQRFVREQFRERAAALKSRSVLVAVERLLRERGGPGDGQLRAEVERIAANMHDLRELELLSQIHNGIPAMSDDDAREAERIVGGDGVAPHVRLGLPDTATTGAIDDRIDELLLRWRTMERTPLRARPTATSARIVVRTLEGLASEVGGARFGSAPDVVTAGGPLQGRR